MTSSNNNNNNNDGDEIEFVDWIDHVINSKSEYVFGRRERSRLTILKQFHRVPKTLDEPLAPKESIFLDFLEMISYTREMAIIEMIKEDVYLVKLVGKLSLIKFGKHRSVNAINVKAKEELTEIAKRIDNEYPIEEIYLVWTKPNGSSEIRKLANLKRQ